jgi:hypothetical protein
MPAEISNIKPDASMYKRPEPDMEWNKKTEESYRDNGFSTYNFSQTQERTFLSQVDIRKAPVKRTVTKIVRLKAIDWSTEKGERKEYLYYYENWEGVNWLGIRIAPVTDHIEGYYYEQLKEAVFDPKTGEPIKYKRKGQREAYYIPFDKKTVDKIIKESTHSSQESISYIVKFGAEEWDGHGGRIGTRAQFTYDQFTNWSFKDLYDLNRSPVWNELADPNNPQNKNRNIGPVAKSVYK